MRGHAIMTVKLIAAGGLALLVGYFFVGPVLQ